MWWAKNVQGGSLHLAGFELIASLYFAACRHFYEIIIYFHEIKDFREDVERAEDRRSTCLMNFRESSKNGRNMNGCSRQASRNGFCFWMCVKAHSIGTSNFLAYMSNRPVKRLTLFYLMAPSFVLAFLIWTNQLKQVSLSANPDSQSGLSLQLSRLHWGVR